MIVVSDTTPLSSLILINRLYLLREIFHLVLIPTEVASELNGISNFKSEIEANNSWINIVDVTNKSKKAELMLVLDEGESAAIALAIEKNANLLLVDERKGKSIAENMGLHTTGTLGILVQAKRNGLLKEIRNDLYNLLQHNFWISDQLIKEILLLVSEE